MAVVPPSVVDATSDRAAVLADLLATASLRSVYQPIVDLDDGTIVAYEALSRGPEGSLLERPDDLFDAARSFGGTARLDELCLVNALRRSADRLGDGLALFVNVEPSTLDSALIQRTAPVPAAGGRAIVLEITERSISSCPHELLTGIATAREHGWRIALDDVGVDPASLAMLPIVRPDVVKLDMGLVRDEPDVKLARTMAAVMAYAERSGATVLAEGIETDQHLERALSLGATLGQGYRFGHPGDLPARPDVTTWRGGLFQDVVATRPIELSPFDAVVATGAPTRTATKRILLQISHHIEEQAAGDAGSPIIVSAFQAARHFTPATTARYRRLADTCSVVGALGVGMPAEPVAGVRGARLFAGDPLADEWSVVVLGPHYCGALLARDLGDCDAAESDRRFAFLVTHDRDLVELAAESLLRRVVAI